MYVYNITIGHVHISAALSPYKHLIVHKIVENDNKTFSNTCPGGSYSLKEQSKNIRTNFIWSLSINQRRTRKRVTPLPMRRNFLFTSYLFIV